MIRSTDAGQSNTREGAQHIGKNEASEIIQKMETDARALEKGVVEDIEIAEKKAETSKTGQRLESIEKEVQAHRDVQIAEKEVKTFANFLLKCNNDWSLNLSGALAYSLLKAMFPIAAAISLTVAFFYYFAVILFLGAEVNAFYTEGKRAAPSDLATLVHRTTSEARHPHVASRTTTRGTVPPV
jgi:hypothetical protein